MSIFLGKVVTIINKTPSEVIYIQLAIAVLINLLENLLNSFNSRRTSFQNTFFQFFEKIINVETM